MGVALVGHGFLTQNNTQGMITGKQVGISGRVGSGELNHLTVTFVQLIGISGTVCHGAVIVTGIQEEGFHGISGFQIQVLDGSPTEVGGTVDVPGLIPLIVVGCAGAGILTTIHVNIGYIQAFIVGCRLPRQPAHTGPQRVGIVKALHGNVGLFGVGQVETDTHFQIVQKLVGSIHTTLQFVIVDAVEYTFALLIGKGSIELCLGVTATGADFIFLQIADAAELVHCIGNFAVQEGPGTIVRTAGIVGIHTGIGNGITLIGEEFLGIHHTEAAVALQPVDTIFCAGRKLGLAFLTALGGYQDNAVGSTGTVSSSSSGILQNGDGLDVVRIEGIQGTTGLGITAEIHGTGNYRNTIHNPQRSVGSIDGTVTTDTD